MSTQLKSRSRAIDGIDAVYGNEEGCARFDLAQDRMGDLILVSSKHVVIGTTAARHDLSGLEVPLRSHGGVTEQTVPLIVSQPVADSTRRNSYTTTTFSTLPSTTWQTSLWTLQ